MPEAPPLTSEMLQEIQRLFPPESIARVSALLLSYGEQNYEREVNRVRWGLLHVSGDDIVKLERMVAMAKRDYRDLIVAAEYTRPRMTRKHDD
ncbi:MAG TPA: hypothetical protein VFA68_11035 [Terriglobales bacterium]|nr:hypothetical protein [Terriglobales bacterium]